MIRLAADENFNGDIVRALFRHHPDLNLVHSQDVEVAGAADPVVLEWAAREGHILLTHDLRTIPRFTYERVAAGLAMPGVFAVDDTIPISVAVEDLLLLTECSLVGEWEGSGPLPPVVSDVRDIYGRSRRAAGLGVASVSASLVWLGLALAAHGAGDQGKALLPDILPPGAPV